MRDRYMHLVMDTVGCQRHKAVRGMACWFIFLPNSLGISAICNNRAVAAGFTGRVNPRSRQQAGR